MSANRQVLFVSTPNDHQISKNTTNLKFHIIKSNEKDKYVKQDHCRGVYLPPSIKGDLTLTLLKIFHILPLSLFCYK